MARKYFTKEEIEELSKNEYVEKVTKVTIVFTKQFKQKYYGLLLNGTTPILALTQLGIKYKILGRKRVGTLSDRVRKQAQREGGFDRKKGTSIGRPKK